ncbi:MAG: hypothetical protein GY765_10465, partial [bacterium]|nr:hypothetical protein [bacterium]
ELKKQQESYWLEEYSDGTQQLNLPLDSPRSEIRSVQGSTYDFEIDATQTHKLQEIARAEGVTMFVMLLALFNILLSKLSGSETVVIGTPVSGRRHIDLERVMGMFVNTLPLKNHLAPDTAFKQFLAEVKEHSLQAFDNQDYPLEDLVDKLLETRDPSRHPIFDVLFSL